MEVLNVDIDTDCDEYFTIEKSFKTLSMKVLQKSVLNIMYDCQYWGAASSPPHKTLLT